MHSQAAKPDAIRDDLLIVRDPDDGTVIGELAATGMADLEAALERGVRASRDRPIPSFARAEILNKVADRVEREAESHAVLIATEGIKTIREARREVARTIETLRLSAEEAKRIGGAVVPFDQSSSGLGRVGCWSLRPAGLVVAITPFNDPLNLVAHKLGPAFALGAPVILKPHPQTPYSALRLVDHFHEAGAREDMVQIVVGGADRGSVLVADSRPRIVSFTGGREAGAAIAATTGMKRLLMELGGVGIVAVAADASLDVAIDAIHSGAFWAAGQNCVHAQRIIADEAVIDALTEGLLVRRRAMTLGSKQNEATDMGPVVNPDAGQQILSRIAGAASDGAHILCGGQGNGSHIEPTWIAGVPAGHALLRQEIFGPVGTIEVAHGEKDIFSRLAKADAAIHAAIFTNSIQTALSAYEVANAGAVIVNDSTDFRIDAMPFGGSGAAGLGREGVADAIEAMADKKLLVMLCA